MKGSSAAAAARFACFKLGNQANPSLLLFPRRSFHVIKSNSSSLAQHSLNPQRGFVSPIRAIHEATVAPKKQIEENPVQNWKVKMLYDGDCPLCMREVNMLRERNKQYGTIKFVDISSNKYSPEENQGLDYKTAMGRIHAILADGSVVTDVEAFRRLYEEVGLGWVYAITKYKPVAKIADVVYGIWAKYRLQITVHDEAKRMYMFSTMLYNLSKKLFHFRTTTYRRDPGGT